MKIKAINSLDVGTKGFSVEARVLNCYDVQEYNGQYGPFKKQSVQLTDDAEKMYIRLSSGFITKQDIGKEIAVTDCTLDIYKGDNKLETSKDSIVTIDKSEAIQQTAEKVEKTKEDITPPNTFNDVIGVAIEEASSIITHPAFKEYLENAKNAGLTSEDARAMLISRLIHLDRKNNR